MMSQLSLRLPETLYAEVKHWAEQDGKSLNQWILDAVAKEIRAKSGHRALDEMLQFYREFRAQNPDAVERPVDLLREIRAGGRDGDWRDG